MNASPPQTPLAEWLSPERLSGLPALLEELKSSHEPSARLLSEHVAILDEVFLSLMRRAAGFNQGSPERLKELLALALKVERQCRDALRQLDHARNRTTILRKTTVESDGVQEVLEIIQQRGAAMPSEVANVLRIPHPTVRKRLTRLRDAGLLVRTPEGYVLPERGGAAP
jgi:hypothetical protein